MTAGDLAGACALVTGGARGIGHAICRHLAAAGAAVIVNDIDEAAAGAAAAELTAHGYDARPAAADVGDHQAVQAMVASLATAGRPVSILVNNASIVAKAPIVELTEEDWDAVVRTNLKGVFNCTQAVLPAMIGARHGRIVNIASIAALGAAGETRANYASAKAGVIQFTKVTAREHGRHGVTANAVAPGLIRTSIWTDGKTDEEVREYEADWVAQTALGRAGEPDDIAALTAFLVGPAASFITAQVISVDGGYYNRL